MKVTVVGHIVSVEKHATNCVYIVDDSTGSLEARHWPDKVCREGEENEDEARYWSAFETEEGEHLQTEKDEIV